MSLLVLSASEVARVAAKLQPDDLVNLMARVFYHLSKSETDLHAVPIHQPHRITLPTENHTALIMPSRMGSIGTAMKVVSVPTINAPSEVKQRGLPASTLVLDEQTGSVKAIVNAGQLTALRNAAGSLLSTRLLLGSRAEPKILLTIGAGAQISAHVTLFLTTYPSIAQCTMFNRSMNSRFSNLVNSLTHKFPSVHLEAKMLPGNYDDPAFRAAVQAANIIITATSSTEPFFPSTHVSPGTHLCLVGSYTPAMHEVDTQLIRRSGKVVVDSTEAALSEAGELVAANLVPSDVVELGGLVQVDAASANLDFSWSPATQTLEEVKTSGDVTIFKSVGVGVQDVAIAAAIVELAQREQIGTLVDDYNSTAL